METKEWWDATPKYDLNQGDIFEDIPLVVSGVPPEFVQKITAKGAGQVWKATGGPIIDGDGRAYSVVQGPIPAAMILNHGCDLDKPKNKYISMASVRPLTDFPESQREQLKEVSSRAVMYLPGTPIIGDAVVDLRTASLVPVALVKTKKRIASLTEEARLRWVAQIVTFYARIDLAGADLSKIFSE